MNSENECRPYYSYLENGVWVGLDNTGWSYAGWAAAPTKGPHIKPMGGRCVVVLDELPKSEGSIFLATDSMLSPYCMGVVVSAPKDVVMRSALLKGGSVDEAKMSKSNYVTVDIEFKQGDRVYVLSFAGTTLLAKTVHTIGHDRIRLTPCLEVMAVINEGR